MNSTEKIRFVRSTCSCYIERGSVVHTGPDDRQPKRDIHSVAKATHLGRNVTLIMVHGNNCIPLTSLCPEENSIRRNRYAVHIPAQSKSVIDRWLDATDLFITKNGLAMRIQSCHHYAGFLHGVYHLQEIAENSCRFKHLLRIQAVRYFSEWDVACYMGNSEAVRIEAQRRTLSTTAFLKYFRVPSVLCKAGFIHCLLIQRSRHNSINPFLHSQPSCFPYPQCCATPCFS
mmetsp:Transcript_44371/g.81202  ORF Transcript_44371/g.81202 Transcript_44371/m.81202 type:complete len:230 (-) Transcript_44371:148-837(-)